jgi:hypothetical protein
MLKKSHLVLSLALSLVLQKGLAQKEQGGSVVSAGAGYSLISLFLGFDGHRSVEQRSTPVLMLNYDYAVIDRMSIGLSGSFQQFSAIHEDAVFGKYTDRYNRSTGGIRILGHFGQAENMDLYAGGRVSGSYWWMNSGSPDPAFDDPQYAPDVIRINYYGLRFGVQGIFGWRYYFNENLGIGSEISIGPPSCFMANLVARF